MNTKDIKYSSLNNNTINVENNLKDFPVLKTKLITIFEFVKKDFNLNGTLLDLKKYINVKFHIQDYEYELYIGENLVSNFPPDTLVSNLLNKYNINKISIKAFKSIYDVQIELNNYENFLTKNISLKENEISLLKKEYEYIKQDLKNI